MPTTLLAADAIGKLHEPWSGQDTRALVVAVFGIAVVVLLIVRMKMHGFLALTIGSLVVGVGTGIGLGEVAQSFEKGVGDVLGSVGVLIALGAVWAALAVGGVLQRPGGGRAGRVRREVGLGIAAATALSGAQWTIGAEQAVSYGTTFVLAVLCFAAFLRLRSTVLLVFGVLGVTVSVPEAVYDWTGGALGG